MGGRYDDILMNINRLNNTMAEDINIGGAFRGYSGKSNSQIRCLRIHEDGAISRRNGRLNDYISTSKPTVNGSKS